MTANCLGAMTNLRWAPPNDLRLEMRVAAMTSWKAQAMLWGGNEGQAVASGAKRVRRVVLQQQACRCASAEYPNTLCAHKARMYVATYALVAAWGG